jgi:hypothetical protein
MTDNLHAISQLKEIYQDHHVKIEVDDSLRVIYIKWLKDADSAAFRHYLMKEAQIILERRCRLWLSDARKVSFISYADQNWLLHEIVPMLKSSELRKFARVVTEESYALMDAHRVFQSIEEATELKVATKLELFMDMNSALCWLFEEA